MISRLIRESFHAPLLTALLVAAGTVIGAFWLQDLPRDVFPDLSAPVFNVITQNPAMGAEELETAIAIPLEVAARGSARRPARPIQLPARRGPGHDRVRAKRRLLPLSPVRRGAGRAGERAASRRDRSAAHLQPDGSIERNLRVHARSGARRGRPDDVARSRRVRGEQPACWPFPAWRRSNVWVAICGSFRCNWIPSACPRGASAWMR